MARYDLWQLITAEQLRVLPPVEVCQAFMRSKEEERQVKPDLSIIEANSHFEILGDYTGA